MGSAPWVPILSGLRLHLTGVGPLLSLAVARRGWVPSGLRRHRGSGLSPWLDERLPRPADRDSWRLGLFARRGWCGWCRFLRPGRSLRGPDGFGAWDVRCGASGTPTFPWLPSAVVGERWGPLLSGRVRVSSLGFLRWAPAGGAMVWWGLGSRAASHHRGLSGAEGRSGTGGDRGRAGGPSSLVRGHRCRPVEWVAREVSPGFSSGGTVHRGPRSCFVGSLWWGSTCLPHRNVLPLTTRAGCRSS